MSKNCLSAFFDWKVIINNIENYNLFMRSKAVQSWTDLQHFSQWPAALFTSLIRPFVRQTGKSSILWIHKSRKFRGPLPFASPSFSQVTAQTDVGKGTIHVNQKPFLNLVVFSNNLDRELSFNYLKCLKICIWKSITSQGRCAKLIHAIKH